MEQTQQHQQQRPGSSKQRTLFGFVSGAKRTVEEAIASTVPDTGYQTEQEPRESRKRSREESDNVESEDAQVHNADEAGVPLENSKKEEESNDDDNERFDGDLQSPSRKKQRLGISDDEREKEEEDPAVMRIDSELRNEQVKIDQITDQIQGMLEQQRKQALLSTDIMSHTATISELQALHAALFDPAMQSLFPNKHELHTDFVPLLCKLAHDSEQTEDKLLESVYDHMIQQAISSRTDDAKCAVDAPTRDALRHKILLFATRTNYGLDDGDAHSGSNESLWRWEAKQSKMLPKDVRERAKLRTTELRELRKVLRSLNTERSKLRLQMQRLHKRREREVERWHREREKQHKKEKAAEQREQQKLEKQREREEERQKREEEKKIRQQEERERKERHTRGSIVNLLAQQGAEHNTKHQEEKDSRVLLWVDHSTAVFHAARIHKIEPDPEDVIVDNVIRQTMDDCLPRDILARNIEQLCQHRRLRLQILSEHGRVSLGTNKNRIRAVAEEHEAYQQRCREARILVTKPRCLQFGTDSSPVFYGTKQICTKLALHQRNQRITYGEMVCKLARNPLRRVVEKHPIFDDYYDGEFSDEEWEDGEDLEDDDMEEEDEEEEEELDGFVVAEGYLSEDEKHDMTDDETLDDGDCKGTKRKTELLEWNPMAVGPAWDVMDVLSGGAHIKAHLERFKVVSLHGIGVISFDDDNNDVRESNDRDISYAQQQQEQQQRNVKHVHHENDQANLWIQYLETEDLKNLVNILHESTDAKSVLTEKFCVVNNSLSKRAVKRQMDQISRKERRQDDTAQKHYVREIVLRDLGLDSLADALKPVVPATPKKAPSSLLPEKNNNYEEKE